MSQDFTPPEPDSERNEPPSLPDSELPPYDIASSRDPFEGAVPPGYDWPTHGGYLGCLVGLMASCLIAGFLSSTAFAVIAQVQHVPGPLFALFTVFVFLVCFVAFGRLGWGLGKRFYREYPQKRAFVWGEDDEEEVVEGHVEDPTTSGIRAPAAPRFPEAEEPPVRALDADDEA